MFGWGFAWPQALAVVGSHLWVANRYGDSVTELNTVTGALVRVIAGPAYGFDNPDAITLAAGHVWVVNNSGGSVTELDAANGSLVRVISGPRFGLDHPDAIAAAAGHVWVVNNSGEIGHRAGRRNGSLVRVISGPRFGLNIPTRSPRRRATSGWSTTAGDRSPSWTPATAPWSRSSLIPLRIRPTRRDRRGGGPPLGGQRRPIGHQLDASTGALVRVISDPNYGLGGAAAITSSAGDVWISNQLASVDH